MLIYISDEETETSSKELKVSREDRNEYFIVSDFTIIASLSYFART